LIEVEVSEIKHIDFEQSYLSVVDFSEASIANITEAHQLPFLAEALASIKEASDYVDGFVIRHYLHQTIKSRSFSLKSPFDGRLIASKSSVFLYDKSTFVFFDNFVVGIGHVGMGFPIMALIIPEKKLFLKIIDDFWGIKEEQFPAVAAILKSFSGDAGENSHELQLLSGDPNFAHNAWNQLSALESVVDCDLASLPAQLISTHEPLASMPLLFPELAHWNNYRVPDWELEAVNKKHQMTLPVGGSFIQKKLVDRILNYVEARPKSESAQRIIARAKITDGPILWMSIRTRNRTAANLNEALIAIGKRFLADYPQGFIILDGHSVGYDFATNPGVDKSAQLETVKSDMQTAERVAEAFVTSGDGASPVELAIGLDIAETIYLAQLAGFYFCHHGTVQHKIGWFTSCPGIVHTNVRTTEGAPAPYVKGQSEVADLPVYVPLELIKETDSTDSESDVESVLKLENYKFDDISALVQFTGDQINSKLEGRWTKTGSGFKGLSKLKKIIERLKGSGA
jgi:hypothetical protein